MPNKFTVPVTEMLQLNEIKLWVGEIQCPHTKK